MGKYDLFRQQFEAVDFIYTDINMYVTIHFYDTIVNEYMFHS
jgi:hypothetical protein